MVSINDDLPEYWDAAAVEYETTTKRLKYFDFVSDWMSKRIPDLRGQGELRVLDLGCGTGLNVKLLRDGGTSVHADGIDISPAMLEGARASGLYRRLHAHNLDLTITDFTSDEYDLIIAFGFLEFLSHQYVCLAECRRLLKKGGMLWATFQRYEADDPGSPPRHKKVDATAVRGNSAAEILHSMTELGLDVVELKTAVGYVTVNGFACPYYTLRAKRPD